VTDARVLHALAWLGGNNDIIFGVWSDIIPRPYWCRWPCRRPGISHRLTGVVVDRLRVAMTGDETSGV